MVMSWIWTGFVVISLVFSLLTGRGQALAPAILEGAQAGVSLAISMAGSICLWSGIGKLMAEAGLSGALARLLSPVINRLFPETRTDLALAGDISSNICSNFLGLGNAATPPGISAARRMAQGNSVTDSLCRFVVLNTASIQLIPANVAAIRASLGCSTPFDILPAVWISSIASASLGLLAAWGLGKLWPHD